MLHSAVGFSIGGRGYIGTGYDGSSFKKEIWEYDPVANTWAQKADFGGTARANAVGLSVGSKGYIGTGYGIDGSYSPYPDFWEHDIVTTTDGVCGTSSGQAFTSAPATNLCSVGTPTVVTGSGPWAWMCEGFNGGTAAVCNAGMAVEKIPMMTFTDSGMNLYLYNKVLQTMDTVKQNNDAMIASLNSGQTMLVYTELFSEDPNNGSKTYKMCLYDIASKTTNCLATPTVEEDSAAFDSNGKILFIDNGGDGLIKKMNPDGTNITTIATPVSPYRFNVFWLSPDRQKMIAVEETHPPDYFNYDTMNLARLVLMNADGSGRTVIKTEYLGEWNMLFWNADSSKIFYYYHTFNVMEGVYQGKTPHYAVIDIPGGAETDLTGSALGGKDENVCGFTKSGNLLSLTHHELYNGQTGALIAVRADAPSMMEARVGFGMDGEIYFAGLDGTNFRRFIEFAKGDLNSDGQVNLTDAILSMQVLVGMNPTVHVSPDANVNEDAKIGPAGLIYILQRVADLRQN